MELMSATGNGFLARYDGNKCLLCGLGIHAGYDLIVGLGPKGHYRHVDCTRSLREYQVREAYSRGLDLNAVILWIYNGSSAGTIPYDEVNDWITYAQEVA